MASRIPNLHKLRSLRQYRHFNKASAGVGITLFAVVGTILLFSSHAATPFASIEPEQGTIAGAACQVPDVSASGAKAVRFGGCQNVGTTNQISQYGVTWTFDRAYQYGQFISGDYWVVGPVKITSISPGTSNDQNGSMLNPVISSTQGYVNSGPPWDSYDPSLNVALNLPLTLNSGSSLTSSITKPSGESDLDRPYIKSISVLTVLGSVAPSGSFRPPFAGGSTDKSIRFNKSQLDFSKLPKLTPPAGSTPPTLSSVERHFERPWVDVFGYGYLAQYHLPVDNMKPYGVYVATEVEEGALSLILNYTDAQKEKLLIGMVQTGIDTYALSQTPNGHNRWDGGGGHNQGRKTPIVIAGIVLNNAAMKTPDAVFSEDDQTLYGQGWWGTNGSNYSNVLWREFSNDSHESKHPSTWTVDGRGQPGDPQAGYDSDYRAQLYRHCCSSNVWAGQALAIRLMSGMDEWNDQAFFDYVDRWMRQDWAPQAAIISQATGQVAPNSHGSTSSDFVKTMWDAYR